MIIHMIDGTYELFRHYYGLRRLSTKGLPFGAVAGVLGTVIQMLEGNATHIGVATDHIILDFRVARAVHINGWGAAFTRLVSESPNELRGQSRVRMAA